MLNAAPLQGHCVCLTRATHQVAQLQQQLTALGAQCLSVPTMHIEPLPCQIDPPPINQLIHAIFTSSNAVPSAATALRRLGRETIHVAVGPATASALAQHQLHPHHVAPAPYGSDALMTLPLWSSLVPAHNHIMVFAGQDCGQQLHQKLRQHHLQAHMYACYQRSRPQTTIDQILSAAARTKITMIISTSGDHLSNLWHITPAAQQPWLRQTPLLVISRHMAQQAKALGFHTIHQADNASTDTIIQCILAQHRAII